MRKVMIFVIVLLALIAFTGVASAAGRTFTLNADFDEGTMLGVEHTTIADQLQLSSITTTFPFIWVPNNQGTVSKIDTGTGKEIARYWVSGVTLSSPSRTTVDLQGNAYVAMRQAGTVVKIGLDENGGCIDRNGNGIIETSRDINNDGDITGAELLAWGSDECVLYEVVLIDGRQGTFVPGTYTGGYDTNYWGTSPRGLAIDGTNNVWAGTWSSEKFYYIDGATGTITKSVYFGDLTPNGAHGSYGAVIDRFGTLWSATYDGNRVLRMDTNVNSPVVTTVAGWTRQSYGIGIDNSDHVYVTTRDSNLMSRIDALTGSVDWTKTDSSGPRGVVATADNDIWTANSYSNNVQRFDNNGNWKATISGFAQPTGVAVDAAGKVWATNLNDDYIKRINPATNSVDLSKDVINSGGHYTYSDMTGVVVRTITTKIGTWTVTYDSGTAGTEWGKISWNSLSPTGTQVAVRVRSSGDGLSWSSWETATNGGILGATPDGKFIQIETTLQIISGQTTPVLYDLTVEPYSPTPCTGSSCVPEFPSLLVPVTAVIGMMAVVSLTRLNRK